MKKKLFIVVLGLFLFVPILNVKADTIELTQAMFNTFSEQPKDTKIGYITKTEYGFVLDPNDYVFEEDLTIDNNIGFTRIIIRNGDYNLNLNNHSLNTYIDAYDVNLVIDGEGTIEGGAFFSEESTVIIKNGTFNDSITVEESKLVIENGTFNSGDDRYTLFPHQSADIEIIGGTFKVSEEKTNAENSCFIDVAYSNVKLVIKDGTFIGGKYGIYGRITDIDGISLQGGTFEGNEAAIFILGYALNDNDFDNAIDNLLGEGFMYSPSITKIIDTKNDYNYFVHTEQKSIKVVPKPVEPTEEETTTEEVKTKNPKTNDSIINYVLITILCITSLIIIKKTQ